MDPTHGYPRREKSLQTVRPATREGEWRAEDCELSGLRDQDREVAVKDRRAPNSALTADWACAANHGALAAHVSAAEQW